MATTEERARVAVALLDMNGRLDELVSEYREQFTEKDITTVAGNLTVKLLDAGPYFALSMAVAAILRLSDQDK